MSNYANIFGMSNTIKVDYGAILESGSGEDITTAPELSKELVSWLSSNPKWVQNHLHLFDNIYNLFPLRDYQYYGNGACDRSSIQEKVIQIFVRQFPEAYKATFTECKETLSYICNLKKYEKSLASEVKALHESLLDESPISIGQISDAAIFYLLVQNDSSSWTLIRHAIKHGLQFNISYKIIWHSQAFKNMLNQLDKWEHYNLISAPTPDNHSILHAFLFLSKHKPSNWVDEELIDTCQGGIELLFQHYNSQEIIEFFFPSGAKKNVIEAALSDDRHYRNPELLLFMLEQCKEKTLKKVLNSCSPKIKKELFVLCLSKKKNGLAFNVVHSISSSEQHPQSTSHG